MDLNFERKLFLYFCYDKVRNLFKWCPFYVAENASVRHLRDFDAYKEYASLYCSFQRKNREHIQFTIGSYFSVHYRSGVLEHAGSLESTREA